MRNFSGHDAHRPQGVDLLEDGHAGQLGRDRGADLAGQDDPGHERHELAEHGVADEVGDVDLGPEQPHLVGRGDRDGHADEEQEHADDGIGPVAHEEHLVPGLPRIDALALLEVDADVVDLVAEHGQELPQDCEAGEEAVGQGSEEPARPASGRLGRRSFRASDPPGRLAKPRVGPGQRVGDVARRRRRAGSPDRWARKASVELSNSSTSRKSTVRPPSALFRRISARTATTSAARRRFGRRMVSLISPPGTPLSSGRCSAGPRPRRPARARRRRTR